MLCCFYHFKSSHVLNRVQRINLNQYFGLRLAEPASYLWGEKVDISLGKPQKVILFSGLDTKALTPPPLELF